MEVDEEGTGTKQSQDQQDQKPSDESLGVPIITNAQAKQESVTSAEIQLKNQKDQEKQNKLKTLMFKLIGQIKKGCNKDICFQKFCSKNPLCKLCSSQELVFPTVLVHRMGHLVLTLALMNFLPELCRSEEPDV